MLPYAFKDVDISKKMCHRDEREKKKNWHDHCEWFNILKHQSHGNDSEGRKLSAVLIEFERYYMVFVCLETVAYKTKTEGISALYCDWG